MYKKQKNYWKKDFNQVAEEDKYILVLGSKPGSQLPNQDVKKIYTANGSAERANHFRKKIS